MNPTSSVRRIAMRWGIITNPLFLYESPKFGRMNRRASAPGTLPGISRSDSRCALRVCFRGESPIQVLTLLEIGGRFNRHVHTSARKAREDFPGIPAKHQGGFFIRIEGPAQFWIVHAKPVLLLQRGFSHHTLALLQMAHGRGRVARYVPSTRHEELSRYKLSTLNLRIMQFQHAASLSLARSSVAKSPSSIFCPSRLVLLLHTSQ